MISSNWSKVIPAFKVLIPKGDQSYKLYYVGKISTTQNFFFVCKRLGHLFYSENEIYSTFLWLKFRSKSLVIAKGTVVVTIMTKVVSEVTNELTKHVPSLDSGTKHQHYRLLRRLEIIFNTLMLPLYKRGKKARNNL